MGDKEGFEGGNGKEREKGRVRVGNRPGGATEIYASRFAVLSSVQLVAGVCLEARARRSLALLPRVHDQNT